MLSSFYRSPRNMLILLACVVFMADQLSKWAILVPLYGGHEGDFLSWLVSASPRFGYPPVEITGFFNLVMVWNHGISFGMFNDGGLGDVMGSGIDWSRWLLSGLAVVVSVVFAVWGWRVQRMLASWAFGLIIGGALGNVLDRLRFGAVADFFDVHVLGFHWPAFNIADAAIVIGAGLFMWDAWREDKRQR